ncbi:MAG: glycoside hydrolase family 28 protein [Alistipes sp.]|nr:glycoside hydrolase family 28 protein [Alistipes sp.]
MKYLFALLCATFALSAAAQTTERIPTRYEVGADAMPHEIASIEAPFYMPEMQRPTFRDVTVRLTAEEGKQMRTREIQRAIDRLSKEGGGRVVLSPGVWHTGRIELKSDVELHVEEGAEVRFSGEVEDFLPVVFTTNAGIELYSLGACIYANGAENIALTGRGRLIGPAQGGTIRQGRPQNDGEISPDTPVEERIFDGKQGRLIQLPTFFGPINCKNVFLEGLSFENTSFWNIAPVYCEGVIIRGIRVSSYGIPCGDGVDITCCRHVLVEYVTTDCGDDNIAIKGGRNEFGYRVNRASENIVVRHCLALRGMGGLTVGSETAGWIRNLYAHDCVCEGTRVGIRLKTRRPRGGGGENLYFERIRLKTEAGAMAWEMLGTSNFVGGLASRLPAPALTHMTPSFRNVEIREVEVEGCRELVYVQGIPESPARNIRIENVTADTRRDTSKTAYGVYKPKPSNYVIDIVDADGVELRNFQVVSDKREVRIVDGRHVTFENITLDLGGQELKTEISGDMVHNLRFERCTPAIR